MSQLHSRRTFLKTSAALCAAPTTCASLVADEAKERQKNKLAGEVGITTSSLSGHVAAKSTKGKISLLELPRVLRDELDMRVIDLNTSTLGSYDKKHLDQVRKAADDAGCVLTNLKLNQRGLDMNSPDDAIRGKALAEYKRSIEAAGHLGLRWARPLPLTPRPDIKIHVASYQELADYAAKCNVQMLVENYGWMQGDPNSVVELIKAVGHNVAACPDTGNWNSNELRYAGLEKTFPIAVTCDYKARQLGPNGEHGLYDLKRCFTIGWQAGFRGPWCLEHANSDRKKQFTELALLRDMLRGWMKEAQAG